MKDKVQNKKFLLAILLIIWMLMIFHLSSQNAIKSESLSDHLVSTFIDITPVKVSNQKKEEIIDNTRLIVRKTAHFTSYFILGVLAYLIFSNFNIPPKRVIIYTLLLCFLYACSDEVHQLFSSGRTARILDVFIDTCGSICACFIAYYLKEYKLSS